MDEDHGSDWEDFGDLWETIGVFSDLGFRV